MKNRNTLGVSMPDKIDDCLKSMDEVLKVCEPFNDFDSEANEDFVNTCKAEAKKILDIIRVNESINESFKNGTFEV